MPEQKDILLSFYQEHNNQMRHHEIQRANMASIIVVVAAGILAFIANNGVTRDKWPLAFLLLVIGLFGALFSAKQYEMLKWNKRIAAKYQRRMEALSELNLNKVRRRARKVHRKAFPMRAGIPLSCYWIGLHTLIAGLGLLMLYYVLRR